MKNELILILEFPQYYLSLVHQFHHFVVLGCAKHSSVEQKVSDSHLLGVRYVECLVGKNTSNQITNENFNSCL